MPVPGAIRLRWLVRSLVAACLVAPPGVRAQPRRPPASHVIESGTLERSQVPREGTPAAQPPASHAIESGTLERSQAPREGTPAAQPPASHAIESRRQFMIGERLFRSGRYREAARAYQRGYRLSHRPGFLINIAHCQVRLGRLDLAREQYRRFLAKAPDAPHAARVAQALADIEAQLAPPATEVPAPSAEPTASPEVAAVGLSEPPPLPLGARDRLHQPSPAEQALRAQGPALVPGTSTRRWLWPTVGVAAAVVAGTVAVFVARDQRPAAQSRGSIGTIRR
jgi:Tetratricopeptide repeat